MSKRVCSEKKWIFDLKLNKILKKYWIKQARFSNICKLFKKFLFLHFFKWCWYGLSIFSAISWAILKLVHRFGILNSDPQTLKSLKINSSKNRQMTIHALVPQCALSILSYSECKLAKTVQQFFSLLCSSKNQHP